MGAPTAAIPHAERGIALYVRERHAAQKFIYGGHDAGACCRYQLSVDLWLIGQPDRALASVRDALRLAAQLQHPLTETITLWFASWIHYQRGDRPATIEAAERLQSLAREHGFTPWTDGPIVLLPAARGEPLDRAALPRCTAASWPGGRRPGGTCSASASCRSSACAPRSPRRGSRSWRPSPRRIATRSSRRRFTGSRASCSCNVGAAGRGRAQVPSRPGAGPRARRAIARAARVDEPGPAAPVPRGGCRGARGPGADPRLVHRGLRHGRPDRREGAPGRDPAIMMGRR